MQVRGAGLQHSFWGDTIQPTIGDHPEPRVLLQMTSGVMKPISGELGSRGSWGSLTGHRGSPLEASPWGLLCHPIATALIPVRRESPALAWSIATPALCPPLMPAQRPQPSGRTSPVSSHARCLHKEEARGSGSLCRVTSEGQFVGGHISEGPGQQPRQMSWWACSSMRRATGPVRPREGPAPLWGPHPGVHPASGP